MKYTKEQLREMSDFEVNKALAGMLNKESEVVRSFSDSDEISIVGGGFAKIMINYCNNPNDIMPLAFDCGLSLNETSISDYCIPDNSWTASESVSPCHGITLDFSGHYFSDKNPLRAIACCLILVLQDK